jgi:single-stranded-DNA-specific exonuclease
MEFIRDSVFNNKGLAYSPDTIYNYLGASNFVEKKIEYPWFRSMDKIREQIDLVLNKGDLVYIYGDYDTDGLMCAVQWLQFFEQMKHSNVMVYQYKIRTHALEYSAVVEAIEVGAKLVIVCDTGSSEEDCQNIERLLQEGIRVIVLDHHKCDGYHSYPEGTIAVNAYLEKELGNIDFSCSGGSLVYIILHSLLNKTYSKVSYQQIFCALVSLYADQVPMDSDFNRNLYFKCMGYSSDLAPGFIKMFFNTYTVFKRRFIDWILSPKINALFRAERFDILNSLFFDMESSLNKVVLLRECMKVHEDSIAFVDLVLQDILTFVQEKKNFVVCNMSRSKIALDNMNYLNYSGLLANKLADRYNKIAVVYGHDGPLIRGSVRDLYGRALLPYFSLFSEAGGHNSAFGLRLGSEDLENFLDNLNILDRNVLDAGSLQDPVIFNGDFMISRSDIECIALYNEFAGTDSMPCYVQKKITHEIRLVSSKFNYKYDWGGLSIVAKSQLRHGSIVLLRPTSGKGVVLYVV